MSEHGKCVFIHGIGVLDAVKFSLSSVKLSIDRDNMVIVSIYIHQFSVDIIKVSMNMV
jgi:hypothetical protein